jgi:hypothetical protein
MRSHTSPQRLVERARIVLNSLEGRSNAETCALLSVSHPTVTLWLDRYEEAGVEGLVRDRPRSGRPKRLDSETVEAENVRALSPSRSCALISMLDVDARCTRRGSAAAPVTRGPAPRLLRRRSTQSAACHPEPVAGVREFACRYARAEGRSGGVCGPRVTPDRLAVDARATFDIALTGTGGEQCLDGDAQTWLKVVHSSSSGL